MKTTRYLTLSLMIVLAIGLVSVFMAAALSAGNNFASAQEANSIAEDECKECEAIGQIQHAPQTTGGPDIIGYTFIDSNSPGGPTYSWVELMGTGAMTVALGDDAGSDAIPIGFNFNHYGRDYSELYISSNGYIAFDNRDLGDFSNNCPLPDTSSIDPSNAIYIMWDDLDPGDTGDLVYYDSFAAGTCPYGGYPGSCFVAQYENYHHFPGAGAIAGTFEAILFDNHDVLMQYKDGGVEEGAGSTTGLEQRFAYDGLTYSCDSAASLTDNLAILFDYPEPDLSLSTKTAPTKVSLGERITYTISLLNTGGVAASSVLSDALPLGTTYISGSLTCSAGNCSYDAGTHSIFWDGSVPSTYVTQTRYYATAIGEGNVIYVFDLIKAGWWEPNSWRTVMTFTIPLLSDAIGIDYDAEHEVLYHSDYAGDTIVVTDLFGNYLYDFQCSSPDGVNYGVTYIEGSNPPEVWVTDPTSNQTTRCEASPVPLSQSPSSQGNSSPIISYPTDEPNITNLSQWVLEHPDSLMPPGDVIETFTNTWATISVGLVYNPLEGFVRYAHEGELVNSAEIWDIDDTIPHTALFSVSLSSVNPGWLTALDNRDGAEFDTTTNTYFMPDLNGNLSDYDDNLIEITPEGIILNAWELDGPGNDSYDGSNIGPIVDIALVPVEPILISFAVQADAAYANIITNTATIYDPAMSATGHLSTSTEIVDTLYEFWDFELTDGGFITGTNSDWQWGVPSLGYAFGPQDAHSGVKVWGLNLSGDVTDYVFTHTLHLTTTLPNDPNGLYLQWWDWNGAETGDWRTVVINGDEIWNDGGDVHQPFWLHHTLDISAYAGTFVDIRFQFNACCTPPGPPGWYIDDVAIHSKLAPPDASATGIPVTMDLLPGETGSASIEVQNNGGLGLIWSAIETSPTIFIAENPELQVLRSNATSDSNRLSNPIERMEGFNAPDTPPVNKINDSSFESGTPNGYWEEYSLNYGSPVCTIAACGLGLGSGPLTGDYWAWFGGSIGVYEESYMTQTVQILPGAAALNFWLEVPNCDPGNASDYMELLIDGLQVFVVTSASPLCDVDSYSLVTIDLTAWADNGLHTITFHAETDSTVSSSNFFVDEVVLSVYADIPWLSENPTSGVVGKESSQAIDFLFDSAGLVPGTYTGIVAIATNDEDTPVIFVDITLNVLNYNFYLPVIYK